MLGTKGMQEWVVTEDKLACNVGSGIVAVFATPMMIAGIEGTAAASVAEAVGEGKTTVGIQMNCSHVAATPCGMKVRFETEVTEVAPNGKVITFAVKAFDEAGLIGEGVHQRAVVDKERFEAKCQEKLGK